MNSKLKQLGTFLIGIALTFLVASCGGGSSSGIPDSTPKSASISGTAAVGAPLLGTVTVKDALGATRGPKPIGSNGAYTVDVTGMTPPFLFRAEGEANGQKYIVHSIATSADVNGNINITQLTDLVVANIAHQTASNYFEQFQDNSTNANKAAIDAEVKALTEKLTLVLQALGVDTAIDLLRTPFTPLKDALDKALDAIRVSFDETANTATIATLVNTSTITYDLATGPAAATPLSAENIASGATDMELIKKAVTDLSAKFANGLPTPDDLKPLLTSGFLNDDVGRTKFNTEMSSISQLVGGTFTDITIHGIDYAALNQEGASAPTARISFTLQAKGGIELGRLTNFRVRRTDDGSWKLHGNQQVLAIEGFASMTKTQQGNQECRSTGLNFNIENLDTNNDGGALAYILVTGPGLPAGGLRYEQPLLGGRWQIQGGSSAGQTNYMMASYCGTSSVNSTLADAAIAAIPDNAYYSLTGYTSGDVNIKFPSGTRTADGAYIVVVERRSLTAAELSASTAFPLITTPTATNFFDYVSGSLTVTASNVTPSKSVWVRLQQSLPPDSRDAENTELPAADGSISSSFVFDTPAQNVVSRRLSVESLDVYRRSFYSAYSTPGF